MRMILDLCAKAADKPVIKGRTLPIKPESAHARMGQNGMIRMLAIAALGLAAVPALAEESAEQRLDRCLLVGASDAPRMDLVTAVTAARSFCGRQLRLVRSDRVEQARRGLSGNAADEAERLAVRQLNNEVAITVARLTGLKP